MKKSKYIFSILLSLYLSLAVSWDYTDLNNFSRFFTKFMISFMIFFLMIFKIWDRLDKITIKLNDKKMKSWEYFIYAIIILIPLIFGSLAFYPSIGLGDSIDIYEHVLIGDIGNWHPIPYQLIFYVIPISISKVPFAIAIFQGLFSFIATLYLTCYCRKNYLNFKQTLLMLIIFTFSPIYIKYSLCPIKDVPFTWNLVIMTLTLMGFAKENFKKSNKKAFLISSIGVLIFRHNGIAPFLITYIYLIIFYKEIRKFILISLISILTPFFIITGPVYKHFNLGTSGGGSEMLGIVMANISYYYNNSVEISSKQLNVIHRLYSSKAWTEGYNVRDFNEIKHNPENGDFYKRIDENGYEILPVWLDLSIKNPDAFLKSYLSMTSPIWEINKDELGTRTTYFENNYMISRAPFNYAMYEAYEYYEYLASNSILQYFVVTIGEGLFLILFALCVTMKRTKFSLKALVPYVPCIINTLVIMLLITGEEYRLVYAQAVCYMPLLLYSFSLKKK